MSNDLPKVTQQARGRARLEQRLLTLPVHLALALAASSSWLCHFNIHLSTIFQVPISWGKVFKREPSSGTQEKITFIHVNFNHHGDSDHWLWAGVSSGCACRSAAILSLQQGSMSLSFLSKARFSAVPFPKSKWWQRPRMQSQQKRSHWPAKALQRSHAQAPLHYS